jgi:hypothetical protein
MTDNSSVAVRSRKVNKSLTESLQPYPDFSLSAHPSGLWQKKIRGKIYYFGKWGGKLKGKVKPNADTGWMAALALDELQRDALHAGRTPRVLGTELTLQELYNRFLTAKKQSLEQGISRIIS